MVYLEERFYMRVARVESFKYPRRPRYFQPMTVVEDAPDRLILYGASGSPIYVGKDDKTVAAGHHTLAIMWPDRYYNSLLFWKADWTFQGYYVNLAMPHEWDGELCTYIDLELDVGLFDDGIVRILDEDEYEEGKILYNYPVELIEQIELATKEVVNLMESRTYPFDGSLVNWRPAAA